MNQFTHSDGRIFTYAGTAPHTTKDGREVTLRCWETSCTHPGCPRKFIVKTGTETPNEWKNFTPRKLCPEHLSLYRMQSHPRLVKVRAEGLRKWMASEEGQAALKERAQNRMGKIEKALYNAIQDLSLTDEAVSWQEALKMAQARLPPPEGDKRDWRYYVVMRAITSLRAKGFVKYANGVVTILR
jgi:hypothetical protein